MPLDILRLSRSRGLRPAAFVARYTMPAIWKRAGLPVAKLQIGGEGGRGPCPLLDEVARCTVYPDRPATCRYDPLGLGAIRLGD